MENAQAASQHHQNNLSDQIITPSQSSLTIEANNHVERVSELNTKASSIKLNYVSFRPSLISVSESIKSRTEIKNQFFLILNENCLFLRCLALERERELVRIGFDLNESNAGVYRRFEKKLRIKVTCRMPMVTMTPSWMNDQSWTRSLRSSA